MQGLEEPSRANQAAEPQVCRCSHCNRFARVTLPATPVQLLGYLPSGPSPPCQPLPESLAENSSHSQHRGPIIYREAIQCRLLRISGGDIPTPGRGADPCIILRIQDGRGRGRGGAWCRS